VADLQVLVDQLRLLEGIARRDDRRRSLAWAAGVAATVIGLAGILELIPVTDATVSLVATTGAFTLRGGDATATVVAGVGARSIEVSARNARFAWCESLGGQAGWCQVGTRIYLAGLSLFPATRLRVQEDGGCVKFQVLEGGGDVKVSYQPNVAGALAIKEPAALKTPHPKSGFHSLGAMDWLKVCGERRFTLNVTDAATVMIGDRPPGGLAEQVDVPALTDGSVSIVGAAQPVTLRPTDVLRLGGLSRSVVAARLGQGLAVTVVADAKTIEVKTGSRTRGLMPTQLDSLRNSQNARAIIAVIAAIIGGVFAARQRWLAELD
jgi:hypothetical protein